MNEQTTSFKVGEGLAPPVLGRLLSILLEVGEGLAPPVLDRLPSSIVLLFKKNNSMYVIRHYHIV